MRIWYVNIGALWRGAYVNQRRQDTLRLIEPVATDRFQALF